VPDFPTAYLINRKAWKAGMEKKDYKLLNWKIETRAPKD
jgi:hypothetical protein